jgi:hypothetical protein
MKQSNIKKFSIECEMPERWIPHFLAMLRYMQQLGMDKKSRIVSLYIDGENDMHPNFKWEISLNESAEPIQDENGDRLYDAGVKN